jgi:hypothetical protein
MPRRHFGLRVPKLRPTVTGPTSAGAWSGAAFIIAVAVMLVVLGILLFSVLKTASDAENSMNPAPHTTCEGATPVADKVSATGPPGGRAANVGAQGLQSGAWSSRPLRAGLGLAMRGIPTIAPIEPAWVASRRYQACATPRRSDALDRTLPKSDRVALTFLCKLHDPFCHEPSCGVGAINNLQLAEGFIKRAR